MSSSPTVHCLSLYFELDLFQFLCVYKIQIVLTHVEVILYARGLLHHPRHVRALACLATGRHTATGPTAYRICAH